MQARRSSVVSPSARSPRWDLTGGELWLGQQCLWRRTRPAKNLQLILTAFEEEGWPPRIDDPLFGSVSNARDRLHKAVRGLNRSLLVPAIEFHRDGTGQGICWRLL